MSTQESVDAQRERYDKEASDHAEHHQGKWTQVYRDKFIRKFLDPLDLKGKKVLDAMSASGIETGYLLSRGAEVTGLDISPENAAIYQKTWGLDCKTASVHETGLPDNSYDAVYICGGLHHIIPLLDETMAEIHRILKPGGYFMFVEPNKDTWVNHIRNFWYNKSERFSDEEEAISYTHELKKYLSTGFEEYSINRGGNFAYLLIGQSLTMGIPTWAKGAVAMITFPLEFISRFIPFSPKLFFVGVWQRTE